MKNLFFLVLLFSQVLWSAEYGVFMVVKGKVRVENKNSSVEAKVNSKIQVGDTVVTEKDSRAKIVMSDRNIINVSPDTKLKIEKYTNNGNEKTVNLNLIEGKIRNNVEQKYDNKNSKFEVRTATAVAGVRGTQFIASYNKVTKTTEVITLKGQVSFQSVSAGGVQTSSEPVIVKKGEKSEAKEGAAAAPPVKLPEIEIKQIENETTVKKKDPQGDTADSATSPVASGGGLEAGETQGDEPGAGPGDVGPRDDRVSPGVTSSPLGGIVTNPPPVYRPPAKSRVIVEPQPSQ